MPTPDEEWRDACTAWDIHHDPNARRAFVAGYMRGMDLVRHLKPEEAREVRHGFANLLQVFYGRAMQAMRRGRHA